MFIDPSAEVDGKVYRNPEANCHYPNALAAGIHKPEEFEVTINGKGFHLFWKDGILLYRKVAE